MAAAVGLLSLAVVGLALALALPSPAHPPPRALGTSHVEHRKAERTGTGLPPTGRPSRPSTATSEAPPKTPARTPSSSKRTPTTVATASPNGPRLLSVAPASGGDGQALVVHGSGLFSRNGEVVAYFGGNAAPTSCRTQTSCTVAVPDLGNHRSMVRLALLTENGRSNALPFMYT